MKRYDFDGKTVLVTGASMGIGAVFARELVARGATVVLVARSAEKLERLAAELGRAHVVAADLAMPGSAQQVYDAVVAKGLTIDVLINNAGFGVFGPFESLARKTQREQIDLNVGALVELTHLFMPMLVARQGGVIQVASMAGLMPVPYFAVYAATKAFVVSFSAALWAEYRRRGVRVLCLVPGATDTPFFERAGDAASQGVKRASPQELVALGLAAFIKGRASVVHGTGNRVGAFLARFFSREFVARMFERFSRPGPLPPLGASRSV